MRHLLYELDACRKRAASGDEVIDQQDTLALLDGARVHLNAVLPIL